MSLINKGPSIYVAQNDQEAITIVNQLSGNNYTSIGDALAWVAGQDDIYVQNKTSEDIVTDGLVLYLDVSNRESYPGTGSTWYDLSGNDNHFTLYNGLSIDEYNSSLLFDGTSDYCKSDNTIDLTNTQSITILTIFKIESDNTPMIYEHTNNWNSNNTYNGSISYGGFGFNPNSNGSTLTNGTNHIQLRGNVGYSGANSVVNLNGIYSCNVVIHDFSKGSGYETSHYVNGVLKAYSYSSVNNTSYFGNDYMWLGKRGTGNPNGPMELSKLLIWNRSLTEYEILQVTQATRTKYTMVFGYDTGDIKNSYKGEPTENFFTNVYYNGGTKGTDSIGEYILFGTLSSNGRLGMPYGTPIVAGSTYTFSMDLLCYSAFTLSGPGFDLNQYSSEIPGNDSNRDYGIITAPPYTTPGEWVRYSATVKVKENITNVTAFDFLYIPNELSNKKLYYRNIQLEYKDHVTQYTPTSRSATQSLLDLSGNSTIDLSNVSFDNEAQMVFDGIDDYIQLSIDNYTIFSIEVVINRHTTPVYNNESFLYALSNGSIDRISISTTLRLNWRIRKPDANYYDLNSSTDYIELNTNYHIVITYDGTDVCYYRNGIKTNEFYSIEFYGDFGQSINIGRNISNSQYFNGEIHMTKIYNISLSEQEVKYNYDILKDRFNLP